MRDNMPFGKVGDGEYGTYFIGYCRTPRVTEQMIENMFVGRPPGNYDRLLDFSRAVTGTLFFVPSATFLDALGEDARGGASAGRALDARTRAADGRGVGRFAWNRLPQRRKGPMNNLHRELAPISDAAWAQIEEETKRTLKRYLAGRRVVDVEGPGGVGLSAIGTGHLSRSRRRARACSPGSARSSRWSNCSVPFELDREQIDDVERGSNDSDWQPAKDAAQKHRLCRGSRHLRRLRRGSDRGHPAGDEQPDHDPARRRAPVSGCDRPGA